uniref:COMM domain-containing protein n=1 Tax=Panagrellus redivivus TaxID=6233 RepID=A0A7E4VE56_PANRE
MNRYRLELEMNNLNQGVLHVLLRHCVDFYHLVPGLEAEMQRLPESVTVLINTYASSSTVKAKMLAFSQLSTQFSVNKLNKALNKAQLLLSSYLFSIVHAHPSKETSVKKQRLCLSFKLNKKEHLKVIVSEADCNNGKPVRSIVTAYVSNRY